MILKTLENPFANAEAISNAVAEADAEAFKANSVAK